MTELLLEVLTEEIPARMQARAADDLKRLVGDRLDAARLAYGSAAAYTTPRRLALVVDDLAAAQPDLSEERKGPRVDAPDKAIQGFLGSVGLARADCEERETEKGTFLFARIEKPGRPAAEVLPELLAEAVEALPWPKSMRWGHHRLRFVRPVHGVLCLLDGAPLDGRLDLGDGLALDFGAVTMGHRFLFPGEFDVRGFADYKTKLETAYVMLDPADRRARIEEQATRLADGLGLELREDRALLAEVAGLVEWPVALAGRIDAAFMDLPPEVLTTAMRTHQKYFALEAPDGTIAPHFIVVANMEAKDGGGAIVAGNERVLRARLADAQFFWDQDRKARLETRLPALDGVIFHARLGSLRQKADRIETIAGRLAGHVPDCNGDLARRAARLAKADLVTEMVGEFPELQGVMGRYYATADGEDPAVAQAIREHYSPLGPNDRCPGAPVAVAVALADKIDTLVGFFAIDEKPTGSKDPYALRRAALGIIRLILENGLRLHLREAFALAAEALAAADLPGDPTVVGDELMAFFADRLKVHLKEKGVRHDLIGAVFALGDEDDLVRLLARVEALAAFVGSDDGANLLTAYKRAANIVRIEEKKDGAAYGDTPDRALFAQTEEVDLLDELGKAKERCQADLAREEFVGAMGALSALRGPVDAFFDEVTVNTDDAPRRANRLRLLSEISATLNQVADFSMIEG